MAHLKLYRKELKHNYEYLDKLFKEKQIKWGITTKLICGNEIYLKVGDMIRFKLKYMGALGLMNSFYIEKRIEE